MSNDVALKHRKTLLLPFIACSNVVERYNDGMIAYANLLLVQHARQVFQIHSPKNDFLFMDHTPEEFIPPENFTLVCKGVFRSAMPKKKNFAFLKKLGLKSVLYSTSTMCMTIEH